MGLIDFLEGAYQGGRLLFLLYDHDKQVKLRHKSMKGKGIKRLHSTIDSTTQARIIASQNRPLVKEVNTLRKSPLDEEIELSNKLGYYVNVYTPSNMVDPVEIEVSSKIFEGFTEVGHLYHPYTSTADKVKKIKRLRKRLWERIKEENSLKPYYELPRKKSLPSNGILSHYGDISGGTFGVIGALASTACESLIKASKIRKQHQELTRKEWDFIAQTKTEMSPLKSKQWFLDRIGKTIYRNPNNCSCETCKNIGVHGLTITNRLHALYLYDIQCEYEVEGITLNYRDEK